MAEHMRPATVPVLVVSGPPGVGKTAVALELSNQLEREAIAHTVVDVDALAMTFPRPQDDPHASRLARRNLTDVWRNSHREGSRNLVLARVIETRQQLDALAATVPGASVTLVRLSASDDQLLARVAEREHGSDRQWFERRAVELARTLPELPADRVIDTTGRGVIEVAAELRTAVDWIGATDRL